MVTRLTQMQSRVLHRLHRHVVPLSRHAVEPQPAVETQPEVVITVYEPEISAGLCAEEENRIGTRRERRNYRR